jgi:hypothetical protein
MAIEESKITLSSNTRWCVYHEAKGWQYAPRLAFFLHAAMNARAVAMREFDAKERKRTVIHRQQRWR